MTADDSADGIPNAVLVEARRGNGTNFDDIGVTDAAGILRPQREVASTFTGGLIVLRANLPGETPVAFVNRRVKT